MKIPTIAAFCAGAILAAGITAAAVYTHTREKWHDIGRNHGRIDAHAEVFAALRPNALPTGAMDPADKLWQLDLKASSLVLFKRDGIPTFAITD